MLTRLALIVSFSLAAAGATDAAISRHEATGLVGERSEAVIEKNQLSPVAPPIIAGETTLGAGAEVQS